MRRCNRALPLSPAGLLEEGAKLLDVALLGDVVVTSNISLKTDNERSERTRRGDHRQLHRPTSWVFGSWLTGRSSSAVPSR